jgi:hypothetical protein
MANEFDGLFQTPNQARNEYLSPYTITPQQQASQGLLQQVISVMSNAGAGLGYGFGKLAGGTLPSRPEETQAILQEASKKASPLERAQYAATLFNMQGMTEQENVARKEIERIVAENLKQDKARADIEAQLAKAAKDSKETAKSTADERASTLLSSLETRVTKGETLSATDRALANAAMQRLTKQPLYQITKEGAPVLTREGTDPRTIAPNLARLLNYKPWSTATEMPVAQPTTGAAPMVAQQTPTGTQAAPMVAQPPAAQVGPTVPPPGAVGSIVLNEPAIKSRKAGIDQALASVAQLDQILNQGGKILDLYDKYGTGALSPLNPNPIAQALQQQISPIARSAQAYQASIDAAKAIETIIEMKRSSPTGSTGFGALSNQELQTAQNMYSKLDPTAASYPQDLAEYLAYVRTLKQKMYNDIQEKQKALGTEPSVNYDAIVDQAMKLNPGKSRAAVSAALRAKGFIK